MNPPSRVNAGTWTFWVVPAVTMSLGWGLRGYIGGGPLGAMIPGAMVALLICHYIGIDRSLSARVAAFGAIGIGLGGQMTYGQTIGFLARPETMGWGLLGLTLKGGVWGLIGGAFLGLGLIQRNVSRRNVLIAILLALVGIFLGWKLINEPRLIYFSNRLEKPRAEIWAGLLFGAVLMLSYLAGIRAGKVPWILAGFGLVGGAIGFGGGGLWIAAGNFLKPDYRWVSWWKLMEFTFGLCLGWALGGAASRIQYLVPTTDRVGRSRFRNVWVTLLAVLTLVVATLFLEATIDLVWTYSILGIVLLGIALAEEKIAWQIALTLTVGAFVFDLGEYVHRERSLGNASLTWGAVVISALLVGFFMWKKSGRETETVRWAFLTLTILAVLVSLVKTLLHPPPYESHGLVQAVFLAQAAFVLWSLRRPEKPDSKTISV